MSFHELLEEKSGTLTVCPQEENDGWVANGRVARIAGRKPSVSGAVRLPVVKIFIIYQSDLNRDRARRMQEELTRRVGQSLAFSVSWWTLESLEHCEIRKGAARSIAEADIVCFSLLSGGEIPQQVTTWLDKELLGRETTRLCLLALVESGGTVAPRLSRAEVYLSQLSLAAGVDCLCYSDGIPIARAIRSKQREKQPRRWTRPAKRAPDGGARGDQELPNSRFMLSSLHRLAETMGRENPRL